VAPIIAAAAVALHDNAFQFIPASICLLFALLIQIGTNLANDYYDALKGADSVNRVGPQRAVASGLISPSQMIFAASLVLTLALICGLFLIKYGGIILLPIGLICIILAIAYTGGPFPIAYLGLGDVFVFMFFGPIAVCLTYYVQSGILSPASFWAGCGCGFLASNILVINNYRDKDTDAQANKRTSTVRFGRHFALKQYAVSLLAATLTCIPLCISGFSWLVFSLLLLLIPGLKLLVLLQRATPAQCNPLLGKSAQLLLAYPIILLICVVAGRI